MYKCDACGVSTPANQPMIRKITETKFVEFPRREKLYKYFDEEEGKIKFKDDPGGAGEQIVKEIKVCAECESDPFLSKQN